MPRLERLQARATADRGGIPVAFWWCSLIGGFITLIYANHIGSFPFMLAQVVGLIVYSRNLFLIYKKNNEKN